MRNHIVSSILNTVARNFNVTVDEITSNSTSPTFSIPRKVCYYILHKEHGLTSTSTGNILGGRNHTTVLTGCKTLQDEASVDSELQKLLKKCIHEAKEIVKNDNLLLIKCSYQELFNDVFNATNIGLTLDQRAKISNDIMGKIIKYI